MTPLESRRAPGLAAAAAALLLAGCGAGPSDPAGDRSTQGGPPASEGGPAAAAGAPGFFVDRAGAAGLDFVHVNGASGRFYIPEILAPGVAMIDVDNDGDLDVFAVQGRMLGEDQVQPAATSAQPRLRSRLYRNDLQPGADPAALRFSDITEGSGLDVAGYPMGVAAGDADNDGCVDLLVTGFGRSQFFRGRCDGTFAGATKAAGLDAPGWSVSASFLDYDRDGWLDLYIGNYVHYALDGKTQCHAAGGELDYCTPQAFRAQPDRLYHNERNGRFLEVSRRALVGGHFGPALGVSTADFDNDGWPDIFVANDGDVNQLWMNQRDGTFKDAALLAGIAVGAQGAPEGNMGVDAGDVDNDGDEDLFDTVLPGQGNNLWVNDGAAVFEDHSTRSRLASASLGVTGFGAAWIDVDNDGWLDLLTVNGAVSLKASRRPGPSPYAESKALFRNLGDGRFDNVTAQAGEVFGRLEVSRGAAFGDIDNDGDTDVLVANNNGPLRLLVNQAGSRQHWLGLRLIDGRGRPAIGARVAVTRVDGRTLWRRARSDGSYASASDPRVLAGLGQSAGAVGVRVVWPTGEVERWKDVPADRYVTITQGTGQ